MMWSVLASDRGPHPGRSSPLGRAADVLKRKTTSRHTRGESVRGPRAIARALIGGAEDQALSQRHRDTETRTAVQRLFVSVSPCLYGNAFCFGACHHRSPRRFGT